MSLNVPSTCLASTINSPAQSGSKLTPPRQCHPDHPSNINQRSPVPRTRAHLPKLPHPANSLQNALRILHHAPQSLTGFENGLSTLVKLPRRESHAITCFCDGFLRNCSPLQSYSSRLFGLVVELPLREQIDERPAFVSRSNPCEYCGSPGFDSRKSPSFGLRRPCKLARGLAVRF